MSSLIYGATGRRPGQSYKRAPWEGSYQNISTFVVVNYLALAEMPHLIAFAGQILLVTAHKIMGTK